MKRWLLVLALSVFLPAALVAPPAEAGGVVCYHCECAKCVYFSGLGWSCDYVLQNTYCDCELCWDGNPYASCCYPYPWAGSCRVMACLQGEKGCAPGAPDLSQVASIPEYDFAGGALPQASPF